VKIYRAKKYTRRQKQILATPATVAQTAPYLQITKHALAPALKLLTSLLAEDYLTVNVLKNVTRNIPAKAA
jgi:nucleoside recognition membrane protein YjiH